ncbi:glutaredoxin family protein [Arthrobacter sp. LAPM80]|uniref:glutaredoxin family protein n=1 Tax=Arthrobacter sp. LAPM80 TaxID=3141788 RepID=UPI00398B39EF
MEPSERVPAGPDVDAGAAPAPAVPLPLLELITKTGCHLCDDARAVVTDVAGGLGLPWHEVSIDGNAALAQQYGEEIPVVLVDGIQRDFWHIDPARLRTILRRALASS